MGRLLLACVVTLSGCGQEALPPEPVAVYEACTVRLLADGQVECRCVPAAIDVRRAP